MPAGQRNGRPGGRLRNGQRGVVLLFALIALLVLLIGAVGLIRSFNASLFQAGNIGFKRDLQSRSELAVSAVLANFNSASGLSSRTQRASSTTAGINYSAKILSVDAQGIPDVLTRSDRQDQNTASFVIDPANDLATDDPSVTIRFVVDRLCAAAGDEKTLGIAQCALASVPPIGSGEKGLLGAGSGAAAAGTTAPPTVQTLFVLYRLSALIKGPRNTQSFFQSTFSVPS